MDDNNMRFLEAMSGLDPELVTEAADRPEAHRPRLMRRISPMAAVAAVIAAMAVSAGSAYAVSVYNESRRTEHRAVVDEYKQEREASGRDRQLDSNEFITHYADDSATDVYNKTDFSPIVTENEHIRLTVETRLADQHFVQGIMTLEGLDEEGREFIRSRLTLTDEEFMDKWEQMQQPDYVHEGSCFPWMPILDESGGWEATITWGGDGMFGTEDGKTSFAYSLNKYHLSEAHRSGSVHVTLLDDNTIAEGGGTDDLAPGIFEGMSFDLPVDQNVGTVILTAEDGSQIYISEIYFYGEYDGIGWPEPKWPFVINYQMGRRVTYTGGTFGFEEEDGSGFMEYNHSQLNAMNGAVIDLDGLWNVEYNGKIYWP